MVKQTETAAIKAASHKSGLFARELTGLYTRATLIGNLARGGGGVEWLVIIRILQVLM